MFNPLHPDLVTSRLQPLLDFCAARGMVMQNSQVDREVLGSWHEQFEQPWIDYIDTITQILQVLPKHDFELACNGLWQTPTGRFWIDVARVHPEPFELLIDLIGEAGALVDELPIQTSVVARSTDQLTVHIKGLQHRQPPNLAVIRLLESQLKTFAKTVGLKTLSIKTQEWKEGFAISCERRRPKLAQLIRGIGSFKRTQPLKLIAALDHERARVRHWHYQAQQHSRELSRSMSVQSRQKELTHQLLRQLSLFQFEVTRDARITLWNTPFGASINTEALPANLAALLQHFATAPRQFLALKDPDDGLWTSLLSQPLNGKVNHHPYHLYFLEGAESKLQGYVLDNVDGVAEPKLNYTARHHWMHDQSRARCATNSDGDLIWFNHPFITLVARTRSELENLKIEALLPPSLSEQNLRKYYQNNLSLDTPMAIRATLVAGKAQQRPVRAQLTKIIDPFFDITLFELDDMSANRALESALLETEQALLRTKQLSQIGEMTKGVAHDLGNLLTLAHHYVDDFEKEAGKGAKLQMSALKGVIDDAIAVTRSLQSSELGQGSHWCDLREVLRPLADKIRLLLGPNKHFSLTLPEGDSGLNVAIAASQLNNVIINLVLNARDAMPRRGTLDIQVNPLTKSQDHSTQLGYRIDIIDSGIGIPKELQSMIFRRGFTTKRARGGQGLGLNSISHLLQQVGGNIRVQSPQAGGTCVQVFLPPPRAGFNPLFTDPKLPPSRYRQKTALVVEPDPQLQSFLSLTLRSMGIDCVAANDGKTALRLFRKTALEFDLVLTDLVLPDVGGQALLTEIYQQTPHQRVIIISAFIDAKSQTEFLDQRLKHKPWSTLAKPFKLQELKSIVASSLETPAVNPRSAVRHNRLRPSL